MLWYHMGDIVIEHYIEPILGFYREQTKLNLVILMDNGSVVGWPCLTAKCPSSLSSSTQRYGGGETLVIWRGGGEGCVWEEIKRTRQ